MSVKSKHSSTKKEKIRKKEKRKKVEESEEDIESSEEELDLTKECHTIGYYMNDRAEMINQMFSVIKGNKLKAMLPPILKDCDLETLKLQCLDQLLGMSEKRIQCILEGEILESSSESEVPDSEDEESDQKNGTSSGSSTDRSESHDGEKSTSSRHKKRKSDSMSDGKSSKIPKTDSENPAPEKGKTLLEILELEMRARAIRALLKKGGDENATENANGSKTPDVNHTVEKEITGEVVDLTECEDDEPPILPKKEKPDEAEIDKKVSSFEEKIVKSQEKNNQNQEDEKAKRLQAELELRNKLFKKKIYRTRQQRMENDDEDKSMMNQNEKMDLTNVVVKEEPKEPEEPEDIVIEDPEEGEVSTSEDEYPVEIKQEPKEPEPEPEPVDQEQFKPADQEGERIAAMDNGSFVRNENVDYPIELAMQYEEEEVLDEEVKETVQTDIDESSQITQEPSECSNLEKPVESEQNEEDSIGEISWRERWLRKDGVQKLVKSSKIYAKVKKRIAEKSQKSKEGKEEPPLPYEINSDSNSNSKLEVIEGSIEEYERLCGKVLEKRKDDEESPKDAEKEEVENSEAQKQEEEMTNTAEIPPTNEVENTEAQKLEEVTSAAEVPSTDEVENAEAQKSEEKVTDSVEVQPTDDAVS